jgi:hypothetical protein
MNAPKLTDLSAELDRHFEDQPLRSVWSYTRPDDLAAWMESKGWWYEIEESTWDAPGTSLKDLGTARAAKVPLFLLKYEKKHERAVTQWVLEGMKAELRRRA